MPKKVVKKTAEAEGLTLEYTCQKCLKRVKTTRLRTIKTKDYIGPCGDSFCYASCSMSTCHPIQVTCCEQCAKDLAK